jgi:integrase
MTQVLLTQEFLLTGLKTKGSQTSEEFCDLHPESRGMYIGVSASSPNHGIYRLRTKIKGKTTHIVIGRTNEITLDAARKQAILLKSQIAAGIDPKVAETQAKDKELTFEKFFENHYYPHVISRKRSHKRDRELAVRVNRAMGKKKLSEISRLLLTDFHTALLDKENLSPTTADYHIRFIRHALTLAVDWGMLEKNVASRFPMYNIDNRSNDFLSEDELQRFVQVVKGTKNPVISNLIMFMLSSGLRLGSALTVKWSDVNMENRTISIPACNNKSRRLKTIPVSGVAMEAILSQAAGRGKYEYIWINPKTGNRYVNINKAFNAIRIAAGVPTFHIHGLRRQFATTLANMNTNSAVIKELLNHASISTTERYIRISPKTLHESTNNVSEVLRSAMAAATAA